MTTNDTDASALVGWSRPLDRIKVELYCLGRALMPDESTVLRSVVTVMLMTVWGAMVLGPLFGFAAKPRYELIIGVTAVVFSIVGRMWDFEHKRLLAEGIQVSFGDQGSNNDEDP